MKLKLCGGFIRCSPLYVILCILSIVSENTGVFLNYIGALILHECAHCIMAGMLGCRVSSLELLPYGCRMNINNMNSPWDELMIALSGPVCSLICCMGCRYIPQAEEFAQANMHIAVINLLPAYPLDGGRAIKAVFTMGGIHIGRGVRVASGFLLSVVLGALSCFTKNITLIIFSVFLLSEAISGLKEQGSGILLHMKNMRSAASGRGINVRHIAFKKDVPVITALPYDNGGYAVFCILDDDLREMARIDSVRLGQFAAEYGCGATLGDVIRFH